MSSNAYGERCARSLFSALAQAKAHRPEVATSRSAPKLQFIIHFISSHSVFSFLYYFSFIAHRALAFEMWTHRHEISLFIELLVFCCLFNKHRRKHKKEIRNCKTQAKRVTGEHLNKKTSQNEASNWTLNIALVRFFWAVVYFFFGDRLDSMMMMMLKCSNSTTIECCWEAAGAKLSGRRLLSYTYIHSPTNLAVSCVVDITYTLYNFFVPFPMLCSTERHVMKYIHTEKKSTESILMHNDLWHISKRLFSGLLSTKAQIWIEPMRRRGKKPAQKKLNSEERWWRRRRSSQADGIIFLCKWYIQLSSIVCRFWIYVPVI